MKNSEEKSSENLTEKSKNNKRRLDVQIGHYSSNGTANGRDLFLGSQNGIYYTSENKSKVYVRNGINLLDSLTVSDLTEITENSDPIVGTFVSKGSANGRDVREGKRGGLYYLANGSKSYVTNNLESINFHTPRR